ncbi:MAG TPA: peptide chain release factor N(5)-glutamine methyltransferase [Candidatus Acidoferrum sp.]|jgi:release factor glutamine methyltransferase
MTDVLSDHSVRGLLKRGMEQLRYAQVSSFTLAAELLLLHATARDRTWIYSHPEEILPQDTVNNFLSLIRRRSNGEPTQHLTGKQEFWGLEFEITPDVLIPRPETEHLVEVALDRLAVREVRAGRNPRLTGKNLSLVDIGTGSGCIAIALAKELPEAEVHATDISPNALEIAKRNAIRHGFADRIHFAESNLLQSLSPLKFDLIVSNPPYIGINDADSLPIEVRDHEPKQALFGGAEGYELYGELILQASRQLNPEGLLVLELGHSSLPAVQPLLDSATWANIGVTKDLARIDRVLSAQRLPPLP